MGFSASAFVCASDRLSTVTSSSIILSKAPPASRPDLPVYCIVKSRSALSNSGCTVARQPCSVVGKSPREASSSSISSSRAWTFRSVFGIVAVMRLIWVVTKCCDRGPTPLTWSARAANPSFCAKNLASSSRTAASGTLFSFSCFERFRTQNIWAMGIPSCVLAAVIFPGSPGSVCWSIFVMHSSVRSPVGSTSLDSCSAFDVDMSTIADTTFRTMVSSGSM